MQMQLSWRRRRAVTRARAVMVVGVAALVAVLAPGVAAAAPPANDDIDAAVVVAELPFAGEVDLAEATAAWDDPSQCSGYPTENTVWYAFTPAEDVIVRATAAGDGFPPLLAAYTGDRGEQRLVEGACSYASGDAQVVVHAVAGRTYRFLVAAGSGDQAGQVAFAMEAVTGPANDAFAQAEPVTSVPADRGAELAYATHEAGEPYAWRCPGGASVWYALTLPETAWVTAGTSDYYATVSVFSGTALSDLVVLDCSSRWEPAVIKAVAGETYYVRVTTTAGDQGSVPLRLDVAPEIRPDFSTEPTTVFEERSFGGTVQGALGEPIVSGEWDFGDGTTAPWSESGVTHNYSADGVYDVSFTATTRDGRTGTTTRPLVVETHDVSIARFDVPASGRVGVAKPITVRVANTRYDETVTVRLFKRSHEWNWTEVASQDVFVPARPTRKVAVPFSYTFTPADGVVGRVSFRAVVELPSWVRDARSFDNEVIAVATTVHPAIAGMS